MTLELLLMSALVFLPVAVVAFIALRNTWQSGEAASETPGPHVPDLKPLSSSDLLFGALTHPCALVVPTAANHRAAIYQDLRTAGFYRPHALTEVLALRNVLTLTSLLIAGLLASVVETPDIPVTAVAGIAAGFLGFSLPRLYVQVRGRRRSQQIERGLATGVDLLVLALTAGLNLQASLQRAARELRSSFAELAEEFDITCRQAQLHSLEHALAQLADRVRISPVRHLAIILAQSERLGTDAAKVLLEASNTLQTTMRQRAETQANRASFWMLFPTVGCFLVACGLVIIGPVFLELRRRSSDTRQLLQTSQKLIGKAAPGSAGANAAEKAPGKSSQ